MWMGRKGSWVRLVADGPGRVIKMNDGRWELSRRRGGKGTGARQTGPTFEVLAEAGGAAHESRRIHSQVQAVQSRLGCGGKCGQKGVGGIRSKTDDLGSSGIKSCPRACVCTLNSSAKPR